MCGINGILRLSDAGAPIDREELLCTRDAMRSRGPDSSGWWISEDGTVGLGHRRLSIIDLSEAGRQPMSWCDGRYQIVFNGEIYNYRELREELLREGVEFQSQSDTEVILALYHLYRGDMLARLRGMFAFAIWDAAARTLLLARDPYGIKPLYVCAEGGYLRFASQLKALEVGGAVSSAVDPAGLTGFLLWGFVPEPHTLRRGVRALPAGHSQLVRSGRIEELRRYHRFGQPCGSEAASPAEAIEQSVAAHLVSDVPIALFLSAGLDSSLIAAMARRQLGEPPTTLTLRFDEFVGTELDEAPLASRIAHALGTHHIERSVRREEFVELWPRAIASMDQPSIDGFNTYVVSRIAHEAGYKVVLSGLGGDELLGSYESFSDVPSWTRWTARMKAVPGLERGWPRLVDMLGAGRPKLRGLLRYGGSLAAAYFLRRALFLPEELPALLGPALAEEGLASYDPIADVQASLDAAGLGHPPGRRGDSWQAVQVLESAQYMRNQLLRDSDWASMAHSLELRVPLVDPILREQLRAFDFDPARTRGKASFVREVAPELPDEIWSRPKSGFWVPVMRWLDDDVAVGTALGDVSRKLSLRILEEFGIETLQRL